MFRPYGVSLLIGLICLAGCSRSGGTSTPNSGSINTSAEPTPSSDQHYVPPKELAVCPIIGKPGQTVTYVTEITQGKTTKRIVSHWTIVSKEKAGYIVTLKTDTLTARMTMDPYGSAVWRQASSKDGMKTLQALATAGCLFGFAGIRFPDGKVGGGSVWQDPLDSDYMFPLAIGKKVTPSPGTGILLTWRMTGIEPHNGVKLAMTDFSSDGSAPMAGGNFEVHSGGSMTADIATGMPETIQVSGTSTLTYAGTKKVLEGNMVTKRVR